MPIGISVWRYKCFRNRVIMKVRKLSLPFSSEMISSLIQGDKILLDGTLYTSRDLAHTRLVELMRAGQPSPIPLDEGALFYMDLHLFPRVKYAERLVSPPQPAWIALHISFEHGLKVIIGKETVPRRYVMLSVSMAQCIWLPQAEYLPCSAAVLFHVKHSSGRNWALRQSIAMWCKTFPAMLR